MNNPYQNADGGRGVGAMAGAAVGAAMVAGGFTGIRYYDKHVRKKTGKAYTETIQGIQQSHLDLMKRLEEQHTEKLNAIEKKAAENFQTSQADIKSEIESALNQNAEHYQNTDFSTIEEVSDEERLRRAQIENPGRNNPQLGPKYDIVMPNQEEIDESQRRDAESIKNDEQRRVSESQRENNARMTEEIEKEKREKARKQSELEKQTKKLKGIEYFKFQDEMDNHRNSWIGKAANSKWTNMKRMHGIGGLVAGAAVGGIIGAMMDNPNQ